MRTSKALIAFAAATLLVTGCASKEEPARQAVASAEASLAEVREDAATYAPEDLKNVEASLATLKEHLAWKDYEDVLARAPQLNTEVNALKELVVAQQTQIAAATNEWETLKVEVPKMIEALQKRVDTLSRTRRLPNDLTKEAFEAAKLEFETMKASWAQANGAFTAGNAIEAADTARMILTKGRELSAQLGLKTDATLAGS